jgi:hypothetical protein
LYAVSVDGVATVSNVEGSGEIVSQASKPLAKGVTFGEGNRVKTADKSSAIVLLSNGSKVLVNPNAVVHFKVLKQEDGSLLSPDPENKSQKEKGASVTEIEVESGKVIGDVKKLASGSVFTLKTPVGTVSIKGTVFSVSYQQNKDGTASFSVGCLVGRVSVQMADPRVAPINIPAGKQLTLTAPTPNALPPPPEKGGEKPKEKEKEKEGEKPKEGEQPPKEEPPAPPPMKFEVEALPPAEMKAMVLATPDRPPPPPPAPPAPPPAKVDEVDKVIMRLEEVLKPQQTNPSPTGG